MDLIMYSAPLRPGLDVLRDHIHLFNACHRGVERECLRVTGDGHLSLSPHPGGLGAALTHPQITTDYSESLLEFITPALADPVRTLESLDDLHRSTYANLGDEFLWSSSMPCALPAEEEIPIAMYGTSNTGRLKHVYRKGLALRYGRTMQCIAGIHYNFSLPQAIWPLLGGGNRRERTDRDLKSWVYMGLIRNFHRYNWLLLYLFGASPAVNADFLRGRRHELERLDGETLYLPHATSLRMSDLGYQSHAQSSLAPCYDSLTGYIDALVMAMGTPYPLYGQIGTHRGAEWVQLNTNILQSENEFYSNIRPKRVARAGERPVEALKDQGVEYVEVRSLDINPFLPLGIDESQAHFLDAFLLFCALRESPLLRDGEFAQGVANGLTVAREGRRPGLVLQRGAQSVYLKDWSNELLADIAPLAEMLDCAKGGGSHRQALAAQSAKVNDPSLTPSSMMLATMSERGVSFNRFAMDQSRLHAESFRKRPLPADRLMAFRALADASRAEQARLEKEQASGFDAFVGAFQGSLLSLSGDHATLI
ncbi:MULTISPECIES: glutamate--cysteine ligase [Burkholderiaceae]|nr:MULTISPECIES: glutamate--cysteine ligase [Burkholderiaceae]UTP22242.1 glutamate--cysteine ligase [Burkholderia sp. FXe9]MCA8370477.1 glutamate--cysteine ligase [Burkholderia contaminans]MDN8068918.1 glutamate--cysteine ligase [Burkholderia vietnamiensis]MDP9549916.1 glutamate--cysteine ligase [Burkholderia cepacia]MDP9599877.1 glutamate--cysteine ligase [Burkholderia cepacia]